MRPLRIKLTPPQRAATLRPSPLAQREKGGKEKAGEGGKKGGMEGRGRGGKGARERERETRTSMWEGWSREPEGGRGASLTPRCHHH
jgi:hypothetical protein